MAPESPIDSGLNLPSRAEFNGLIVIASVIRIPGKPKTLYIVGGFYSLPDAIMGVFKYFNKYDYDFEPGSRWFVNTTVALFDAAAASDAKAEIHPEDDLDIMGEIFYMSPAKDASAKYPPVVRVCGRPTNIVAEAGTFNIDTYHWAGFGKKAPFPWSGTIPEGWQSKPIPNPNNPKFVSVVSVLAGTKTVGTLKRFHAEIVSVTFLGSVPLPFGAQSLTPTPGKKRKSAISFEDQGTPTKNARS